MATPAQLVENARCLDCAIPQGLQLPVLISLFAEIADVPLDAATLVANARCLECVPAGLQMAVLISLADTIASAPAPTPAAGLLCGVGAPVAAPTTACGIYLDTNNDAVYVYRLGAWILKV